MADLPPLALSMGDPAGVGPELAVQAWAAARELGLPPFVVVGSHAVISAAARAAGGAVPVERVTAPDQALALFADALPVIDVGHCDYTPGQPDDAGARAALDSLTLATALTCHGATAALVTGPIAKHQLARVGFDHPGQTEFVAAACDIAPDAAVMMLAGPHLRVVPVTVHVPLADVPRLLTTDLIATRATIAAHALRRDFGLADPRLVIAGLNPHAGEDGRMGYEDRDVIAPAVDRLRAAGISASGPHSADTLFHAEARAGYDLAVCMYHDQALIPIKLLDFDEGVNVTLGLPIVRTSPDHGTAFGIAGTGTARAGATIAAIRMAGACAARRAHARLSNA
jgi:4-hydroxythreonine-4-phosphate dehydrogenase